MLENIKSNPIICNLKYLTAHGGEPWPEKKGAYTVYEGRFVQVSLFKRSHKQL
jgi:hypothetical protein